MENNVMVFSDLVNALSKATGTSEPLCEVFLKELISAIVSRLKNGEAVELKGIGRFAVEGRSVTFATDAEAASAVNAAFECFEPIELADEFPADDNTVTESEQAKTTPPELPPIPHSSDDDELPPPVPEEFLTEKVENADEASREKPKSIEDDGKQTDTMQTKLSAPPLPAIPSTAETVKTKETEDEQDSAVNDESRDAGEEVGETVAKTQESASATEEATELQETEQENSNKGVREEQESDNEAAEESERSDETADYEDYEADEEPRGGKTKPFAVGLLCGIVLTIAAAASAYWLGYLDVPALGKTQPAVPTDIVKATSVTSPADSTAPADTAKPEKQADKEKVVAEEKYFTVTETAYLSNISRKYYGHYAFWVYIYIENKDIIKDPDNLPVGAKLRIPAPEKYGIDKNDPESIRRAEIKALEIKGS